jgi:hypothetical protein
MAMTTTAKTVTQMATFKSGLQYCMMRPAAVRLFGRTIAYLKK